MSSKFLHQRKDFKSLISTLSAETSILDALIEKDYWIMHVLYGMKNLGLGFELKGGSLYRRALRSSTASQKTLTCISSRHGHFLTRRVFR